MLVSSGADGQLRNDFCERPCSKYMRLEERTVVALLHRSHHHPIPAFRRGAAIHAGLPQPGAMLQRSLGESSDLGFGYRLQTLAVRGQ